MPISHARINFSYVNDFNVFMCPAAKVRLPKNQWVTKEEHLIRSRRYDRTNPEDSIGIDYEYRGQQEPKGVRPSWRRADREPTKYVLIYDNDNRGAKCGGEYWHEINPEDNHGAADGNKLFSNGSIRWYPTNKWAYPVTT